MRYLTLDEASRQEMLKEIGVKSQSELFYDVPKEILNSHKFNLPSAMTEQEVDAYFRELSNKNIAAANVSFFIGAGCYRHYVPKLVDYLIQRSEFLTAYTPYQPEISQGTLQVIFEFQSMICALTGQEVANASLYDGATAVVEAALMARRINKKKEKIVVLENLNPDYKRVLDTYIEDNLYYSESDIDEEVCAIIVQTPDFYGTPHDVRKYREIADKNGAKLIIVNTEIVSFGMLPAPKEADIVVGEAQSLGVSMGFGGPHLGYLACKKEYVRQVPGRLCGITKDQDGKDGFVLTLNAREQHIRREKATSNICSNQGLNVVAFTAHLALLGSRGLKKLARLNHFKARKLNNILASNKKVKILNKNFFNEFCFEVPDSKKFLEYMKEKQIFAGVEIAENKILITATEANSDQDFKNFSDNLEGAL